MQGACLFMKRLEKGRFVWPAAKDGKVCVTAARLAMLLEGIDWRPLGRFALQIACRVVDAAKNLATAAGGIAQ